MTKYKPCCSLRCALGGCETRENGGCYCVCRLKDNESHYLDILDGTSYMQDGSIIYDPQRCPIPLKGMEKQSVEIGLAEIRKIIKSYEVDD